MPTGDRGRPWRARDPLRAAAARRARHPQPAAGAERPHPWHGARRCAARSTPGQRDPAVTRVVVDRRRRARLLRRRRHPPALRSRPGGRDRGGAALLARGIRAQHPDQALSEALCRADRRHRHGRRRRRLAARQPPGRGRALPVRHAGGRHRLLPRRRRDLRPAAPARRDRHLSRAHRRAGPARPTRWRSGLRPTPSARAPCPPSREALVAGEPVDATLAGSPRDPGPGAASRREREIDRRRCFSAEQRRPTILASARRRGGAVGFAAKPRRRSARNRRRASPSPSSRCAAGRRSTSRRRCAPSSASCRGIAEGHDFYEGVRAAIIDKDGAPRWRPAEPRGGRPRPRSQRHFAPLGARASSELP